MSLYASTLESHESDSETNFEVLLKISPDKFGSISVHFHNLSTITSEFSLAD